MRERRVRRWLAVVTAAVFCPGVVASCRMASAGSADPTFAGATVRIIVGMSPGGSFDLHARLVAAHLGQYLPGHPDVVVENMPGAGGALASSYLSTAAPADGLTVGVMSLTSAPELALSDVRDRLTLLGSPAAETPTIVFSKASGIASVDDWRSRAVAPRFGSTGGRSVADLVPRLAAAILKLPIQMVVGYAGSSEVRFALHSGEVDGAALISDSPSLSSGTDDLRAVLRFGPGDDPRVPDARALAPDARSRALLDVGIYAMAPLARVFAAPRGVPASRLVLLRAGLAQTWADPDFLAQAGAAGLRIRPVSPSALDEIMARVSASTDVLPELANLLRVN